MGEIAFLYGQTSPSPKPPKGRRETGPAKKQKRAKRAKDESGNKAFQAIV